MFDLFEEDLISLAEAGRALPGRPHVSTLWRWVTHGIGPERTRLETVSVGGRRYTSRQALRRFVAVRSDCDGKSERGVSARRESEAVDAQNRLAHRLKSGT
jgi:hypothetical protein